MKLHDNFKHLGILHTFLGTFYVLNGANDG
ncbi:hypothetical protein HYQ21_gp172 [Acinetobacter phage vB_AbaM_Apostate]|uniref:Uncharacterized protein n=1 Tax=Acinetobacter phage vB_AbaM_Apostate TaxID=2686308 RepID=A0A6B9J5G1_9CAUD|nr:hypothetical protein HYQ21_gp172 [Acinetobacter phage vB_AbaM_Apostate]QGZ15802.1 hypothetical protein Apostate_213 [Acinetobacter phage vB_AbaM_Apostate]